MDEVLASYDFKKEVKIDKSELRCIEQQKRTPWNDGFRRNGSIY